MAHLGSLAIFEGGIIVARSSFRCPIRRPVRCDIVGLVTGHPPTEEAADANNRPCRGRVRCAGVHAGLGSCRGRLVYPRQRRLHQLRLSNACAMCGQCYGNWGILRSQPGLFGIGRCPRTQAAQQLATVTFLRKRNYCSSSVSLLISGRSHLKIRGLRPPPCLPVASECEAAVYRCLAIQIPSGRV